MASQVLNASEAEDDETPYVVSFLQVDLQHGRVNASSDDETARVEMGAQFSNRSALRDSLAADGTVPAGLTGVVGRTDSVPPVGGSTTAVDAVPGSAAAVYDAIDVDRLTLADGDGAPTATFASAAGLSAVTAGTVVSVRIDSETRPRRRFGRHPGDAGDIRDTRRGSRGPFRPRRRELVTPNAVRPFCVV